MRAPNCAARAPLDAHDVGARVAEVHREEVLLDVGDAVPQLELAVAVEEGAGRLHGERLDARPQVRRVAHALARHPLDVDHQHAARRERVRVAAALERHVDHLVGQQHRRVRAQLLLHHGRVDGARVAAEHVHHLAHRASVLFGRRHHLDGVGARRVEDLAVEQALEREEVDGVLLERERVARRRHHPLLAEVAARPAGGPEPELDVRVQRARRLDKERLDRAVRDRLPRDARAEHPLLVLDEDAEVGEVHLVAHEREREEEVLAVDHELGRLRLEGRQRLVGVDRLGGAAAAHY